MTSQSVYLYLLFYTGYFNSHLTFGHKRSGRWLSVCCWIYFISLEKHSTLFLEYLCYYSHKNSCKWSPKLSKLICRMNIKTSLPLEVSAFAAAISLHINISAVNHTTITASDREGIVSRTSMSTRQNHVPPDINEPYTDFRTMFIFGTLTELYFPFVLLLSSSLTVEYVQTLLYREKWKQKLTVLDVSEDEKKRLG